MTRRHHDMPFGAALQDDGRTRFRLWAPGAREASVELGTQIGTAPRVVRMDARADGWFEATTAAPAGTRYAYRVDGRDPVPDPASRANPDVVHAPSMVVDPCAY